MKKGRMIYVLVPALVGLASLVSSDRAGAKSANIFQLLTGFSSKETCSCAFVAEQTDEYCKAFGQSAGYDVAIVIDRSAKTVSSSFGGVTRTAAMKDGEGCTGDALP